MKTPNNPYFAVAMVLTAMLYALSGQASLAVGLAGTRLMGTGLAVLILCISFFTPRVRPDAMGQVVLALFCTVTAYLIVVVFGTTGGPNTPDTMNALSMVMTLSLLLIAGTRLFLAAPRGGVAANAGILFLAVLTMGRTAYGYRYPIFSLSVLALLLLALRAGDPGRLSWTSVSAKGRRVTAFILGVSLLVGIPLIAAVPALHQWGVRKIFDRSLSTHIGFSTNMRLGSLRDVLQSRSVVLRISGQKPDYLRGFVYSSYLNGTWMGGRRAPAAVPGISTAGPVPGDRGTRITAVGGDRDRYFVPLNVADIWTSAGSVRGAFGGILLPPANRLAETIGFEIRAGTGAHGSPTPTPGQALAVPERLRPALTRIATRWTADAPDQRAKLKAIEAHLNQDYQYSLAFERPIDGDPLLTFLTRDQQGHCEYFASAMALLARTLGIHTRVVAGYRVYERNPLGGYFVVRERDAHTWVEAWTAEEGWQTYEPTPPGGLFAARPRTSPLFPALLDFTAELFRSLGARIAAISVRDMFIGLGILMLAWVLLVLVRRLLRRHATHPFFTSTYSAPPEAMTRLMAALENAGHPRPVSEPMDRYVARVAENPGFSKSGPGLVRLLQAYNGWRFGGVGDPKAIANRIDEWIRIEFAHQRSAN